MFFPSRTCRSTIPGHFCCHPDCPAVLFSGRRGAACCAAFSSCDWQENTKRRTQNKTFGLVRSCVGGTRGVQSCAVWGTVPCSACPAVPGSSESPRVTRAVGSGSAVPCWFLLIKLLCSRLKWVCEVARSQACPWDLHGPGQRPRVPVPFCGDPDAEPGARVTRQLLLRLFRTPRGCLCPQGAGKCCVFLSCHKVNPDGSGWLQRSCVKKSIAQVEVIARLTITDVPLVRS